MAKIRQIAIRYLDLVLQNHLFIALAAFSQATIGFYILHSPILWGYCFFVFFAAIIAYNTAILRWFLDKRSRTEPAKGRQILLLVAIIYCSLCLCYLPARIYPLVIVSAMISVGYTESIFPSRSGFRPLRSLWASKAFIISIGWIIGCYIIPAVISRETFWQSEAFLFYTARFFLLTALCLEFDIRDVEWDRSNHVKSIPVLIGGRSTRIINYVLLLFSISLNLLNHPFLSLSQLIFVEGVLVLSGILFLLKEHISARYYYLLFLDGILLLQGLMIFIP